MLEQGTSKCYETNSFSLVILGVAQCSKMIMCGDFQCYFGTSKNDFRYFKQPNAFQGLFSSLAGPFVFHLLLQAKILQSTIIMIMPFVSENDEHIRNKDAAFNGRMRKLLKIHLYGNSWLRC